MAGERGLDGRKRAPLRPRPRHQPLHRRSALQHRRRRPKGTTSLSAAVTEAGVDTWRAVFETSLRPDPELWRPIGAGGTYLREDIPGYKLQWYPEFGRLCAEGHPQKEGLCEPWGLEDAYQRLLDQLKEYG